MWRVRQKQSKAIHRMHEVGATTRRLQDFCKAFARRQSQCFSKTSGKVDRHECVSAAEVLYLNHQERPIVVINRMQAEQSKALDGSRWSKRLAVPCLKDSRATRFRASSAATSRAGAISQRITTDHFTASRACTPSTRRPRGGRRTTKGKRHGTTA